MIIIIIRNKEDMNTEHLMAWLLTERLWREHTDTHTHTERERERRRETMNVLLRERWRWRCAHHPACAYTTPTTHTHLSLHPQRLLSTFLPRRDHHTSPLVVQLSLSLSPPLHQRGYILYDQHLSLSISISISIYLSIYLTSCHHVCRQDVASEWVFLSLSLSVYVPPVVCYRWYLRKNYIKQ